MNNNLRAQIEQVITLTEKESDFLFVLFLKSTKNISF